jgi:hypothetical protein
MADEQARLFNVALWIINESSSTRTFQEKMLAIIDRLQEFLEQEKQFQGQMDVVQAIYAPVSTEADFPDSSYIEQWVEEVKTSDPENK